MAKDYRAEVSSYMAKNLLERPPVRTRHGKTERPPLFNEVKKVHRSPDQAQHKQQLDQGLKNLYSQRPYRGQEGIAKLSKADLKLAEEHRQRAKMLRGE